MDEEATVKQYKNLIYWIIKHKLHWVPTSDIEDLYQVGCIGLLQAIRTFDESKGFKFSWYAGRCITNEIFVHIRRADTIKRGKDYKECSTEAIISDNYHNSITLEERLEDVQASSLMEDVEFIELVKQYINKGKITIRDMRVLLLRNAGYDQSETAEQVGCSQSWVSRIERRTIGKLREAAGL